MLKQRGRTNGTRFNVDGCTQWAICPYRQNLGLRLTLTLAAVTLVGLQVVLSACGKFTLGWEWVAIDNSLFAAMLIAHGLITPKLAIPIFMRGQDNDSASK
ncbi:MAG TPA: hypothetical protein VLH56_19260 [Dissulfurispiraceae bacterium]|nr:hypothetical protein [Dissulfurispiraceae bacterium]